MIFLTSTKHRIFLKKSCVFYAPVKISFLPVNNLAWPTKTWSKSVDPFYKTSRKAAKWNTDRIIGNAAVTRNLEPTALFIGLSAGNGGGRQPGRIVQTRKRSEAEKAGRWMLVLVGACDSSSRERAAPPDTIAEHLRSDPRWLTREGLTTRSSPPPTHSPNHPPIHPTKRSHERILSFPPSLFLSLFL